jgi:hypothetical protein
MLLSTHANLTRLVALALILLGISACGGSISKGGFTPPTPDTGTGDVTVVFDLATADLGVDPGSSPDTPGNADVPSDAQAQDMANEVFAGTLCEANMIVETEDQLQVFEGCTELFGDLTIQGALITNLSGLSTVEVIRDNLLILNTGLPNLNGATGLERVKGDLILLDNANLVELDGMAKLARVDGSLRVENNTGLVQINGFLALTEVGGCIRILNQPELLGIDGLWSLQSVGSCGDEALRVDVGDKLKNADFPSLTTIKGTGTTNISGVELMTVNMPILDVVEGDLYISPGPKFTFFFAEQLSQILGTLWVEDSSIAGFTFQNLSNVGGDVILDNTWFITDIGLDILVQVGGDVVLKSNQGLTNLDGLLKLNQVGGNMVMNDNDNLSDIFGLSGMTSLGGQIVAQGNNQLLQCELDVLAEALNVECLCSANGADPCP